MPVARLNDHSMYYEVHEPDQLDPTLPTIICTTGWGTFCHGATSHLPRGLVERYRVIIYDHRGLIESGDNPEQDATMVLRANDVIALLDHLGYGAVHLIGIAGMGACICQEVAIRRPDLSASLVNSGAWCFVDDVLRAQLELWLDVHERMGFQAFQQLVTLTAFDAAFYNAKRDRILGPNGGWSALRNNLTAHQRITSSCLSHNSVDRLHSITSPALVIHMGRDQITAPRLSVPIQEKIPGAIGYTLTESAHVPTGRDQRGVFDQTLTQFLHSVDQTHP